ncbi:hypothetical protein [Chryseobacterium sp.]|uniref:hypothetical protein n=1 Tax=Chryseobacterium sp. TaxID=1871047 RepID=UPI00388E6DC5
MKNIFFLLLVTAVQPVFSQTKLEKAITNLEIYDVQEKVYLLTDKSQYVAGDPIWFKSFVFQGYNKSAISTTLFVELYSADKKLIDSKTILLTNGEGNGDFKLKEDLPEQVYYIRAYTPNMTNFSEDFQIAKIVPIFNANSTERLEVSTNSNWSAKVFPEGGTFVNGLSTKVAVRLSSETVLPESWTGKVIDLGSPAVPVATFTSFDKNVAAFSITPNIGKKYQVIIQDNLGKKQTVDLPQIANKGINLQVSNTKDGIKYSLKSMNLPQQLQNYKIVGTINNQFVYRANINKLVDEATSTIPTKISNEKNAVLQLAIFDEQDNVVAQRLSFIKPNNLKIEKVDIIGKSIKQIPGSFNSIDISPESNFKNYTIVVNDADYSAAKDEENILSGLWLTGDFTSRIDSPAQYFTSNAKADALDALLISENWKKFDWNNLLSGSLPNIKINNQNFLSYKIKPIKNNGLVKNSSVNLVLQLGEKEPAINQFTTDENGYVYLDQLNFNDPLAVSVFINSDKSKEASTDDLSVTIEPLVIGTPFKGNFPKTPYKLVKNANNIKLPESIARAFNNQKNNKKTENVDEQIEEVRIVGKKIDPKEELDKQLATNRFNSINTTIFDFVNENQYASGNNNILDWLQGRAAGLTFQRNNSGENVPYIRGKQAKLYIDEMPAEPTMVTTLPISNIAMVKIIKGSTLVGDAVAIYTMRGNMQSKNNENTLVKNNSVIIKGYDKPSEFFIEMLDAESSTKVENDTRETLYWNPNLFESDYVPPRIKFYNNDGAKQYKVKIISFDKDDNLMYDTILLK